MQEEEPALTLYYDAKELVEQDECAEALLLLEQSAALKAHFKTFELMYVCATNLGKKELALSNIKNAHSLNPKNEKSAVFLAEALILNGDIAEAVKILENVISTNPKYGPAVRVLSTITSNDTE